MHMDRTLPLPMAQMRQEPKSPSEEQGARAQGDDFSAVIDKNTNHEIPEVNEHATAETSQEEQTDEDEETALYVEDQPDIQSVDQTCATPVVSSQIDIATGSDEISVVGLEGTAQVDSDEKVTDAIRGENVSKTLTAGASGPDLQRQDEPLIALKQRVAAQSRDMPKVATDESGSLEHDLTSDTETEEGDAKLSSFIKSSADLIFSNSSGKGGQSEFQDSSQHQTNTGKEIEHLISVESSQRFSLGQSDPAAHAANRLRNLVSQIVVHASQSEGGDLDISLSAEELGLVKISLSKGDRTTLVIFAERLDTLELMRRNSDALQKELRESGLSEFNLEFRQSDTSPEEHGHRPTILTDSALQKKDNRPDSKSDAYLNRLKPLPGTNTNTQNIDIRL